MASSNNSEESGGETPELREGAKFTSFEQLNLAVQNPKLRPKLRKEPFLPVVET
tara:strand:- start:112 stop:273 length:162 start_codon:yes stop_codon:yes gene_type:complete